MQKPTKNILQVCLSPSWGGLEMVAFEFARDFKALDVHIQTLCLADSPLSKKLKELNLSVVTTSGRGFFSQLISFFKILDKNPPDTILCQHLHDLWFLVPATYFKKIRIVGLSHTFLGVSKKDPLHRFLYNRLDRMICMTNLHKQNLLKHLSLPNEKYDVIPNMVDVTKFNPAKKSLLLYDKYNIAKSKLLIGIVGRLDEHKGQFEAIRAMHMLKQYKEQIHLVIVGEDTLNNPGTGKKLKSLTEELQIQDAVTFTGHLSPVENAMASLDILLVPSTAETFGRTIIEGMASGSPVISTRAGGVPDIITEGQTGLLVEPNNPQDLANAIEKLILNPSLREQIRIAALDRARLVYSREVVEQKLKDVFIGV